MTMGEAAEAERRLRYLAGGDPYGSRTIAGARAAYVRGDIEVEEFERRVDLFLREAEGTARVVELQPGEWIIPLGQSPPSLR